MFHNRLWDFADASAARRSARPTSRHKEALTGGCELDSSLLELQCVTTLHAIIRHNCHITCIGSKSGTPISAL